MSTVVIAFDHNDRGLSLALSLIELLGPTVPIRLRLNEQSGLGALLRASDSGGTLPSQITAFGTMREACARNNWVGDDLDIMARAMHADYVRRLRNAPKGPPMIGVCVRGNTSTTT